jgi:hypothetical protein
MQEKREGGAFFLVTRIPHSLNCVASFTAKPGIYWMDVTVNRYTPCPDQLFDFPPIRCAPNCCRSIS